MILIRSWNLRLVKVISVSHLVQLRYVSPLKIANGLVLSSQSQQLPAGFLPRSRPESLVLTDGDMPPLLFRNKQATKSSGAHNHASHSWKVPVCSMFVEERRNRLMG